MVANTRRKRRIIMESDEESEDELQVIEINSDEEQQNDDSIWDFQPLPKSATRYPKRKRKSRFPLLCTREESISGGAPLDPPNDEDYEEEEEVVVDKEEKERKEKEKRLIDSIFQSDDLLIYPFSGKNAVSLQKRDLARLEEDELLNDALIDIYPKILQDEYPQTNIHTFSSLFYTRLTATKSKRRMSIDHSNVKRWTSNHDIFSKTCLIIPIEQRNHWYLVVVIHPALCIKALGEDDDDDDDDNDDGSVNDIDIDIDNDNGDPMEDDNEEEEGGGGGGRRGRGEREGKDYEKAMKKPYIAFLDPLGRRHPSTYRAVCQYLKEEAMDKLKVTEDRIVEPGLIRGDCPRQTNFSDCGIFCLHFIKQIYQNPEKIVEALVKREVEAVTDEHWNKDDIPQLRRVLQSLLLNKFEEYELYTKEKMEK